MPKKIKTGEKKFGRIDSRTTLSCVVAIIPIPDVDDETWNYYSLLRHSNSNSIFKYLSNFLNVEFQKNFYSWRKWSKIENSFEKVSQSGHERRGRQGLQVRMLQVLCAFQGSTLVKNKVTIIFIVYDLTHYFKEYCYMFHFSHHKRSNATKNRNILIQKQIE